MMTDDTTFTVVIIGAGARGNRVFASLIAENDLGFEIGGVVEPSTETRLAFQQQHSIPAEHVFASIDDFLAAPRCGDIAFICTPDPTHYSICKAVSEKGYDVLLEKPIATDLADCFALLRVEQACKNRIYVAHVLRYSSFFRALKQVIDSGELGRIRYISLDEHVGHWHFAHSYVRGAWSRSAESAPIILTKCCHDLDILHWLVGQPVVAVSSRGNLDYFRKENAPAGATPRCVDCPHRETCIYSATRFYLTERSGWPYDVIASPSDSLAAREKAVRSGPYGRCVWLSDNDVCDNQSVTLEFESGMRADFSMYAHTAHNTREIKVLFEFGEVRGDLKANRLTLSRFVADRDEVASEEIPLPEVVDVYSHGGGDYQLLAALHAHFTRGDHSSLVTSLQNSLASHILAFLAEDSRQADGVILPVSQTFVPPDMLSAETEP